MSVTEAQKRATAKYEKENYDKVLVRFPKGTKKRILDTGAESVNGYIIKCVLDALENVQSAPIIQEIEEVEENIKEFGKAQNKANRGSEKMAELQTMIDEKKIKQKERVKQAREQRAAEKREEEQAEVNKIIDRILSGSEVEKDTEKEELRRESIAKSNCPF